MPHTATYLYAIVDQPALSLPEVNGMQQAPLSLVCHQHLAAVVSALPASSVPPTTDNLWQHEAVLEALMQTCTVLPVRFGTLLTHADTVRALLAQHYDRFMASLARVRGCVEVSLRVLRTDLSDTPDDTPTDTLPAPAAGQPGSGRAYLLARVAAEQQRQAQQQQAEALATQVHTRLVPLAVAHTHRILDTPRMLLTAAYLVRAEQLPRWQAAVEQLATAHPSVRLLSTGPWPAYSFVDITINTPPAHHTPD